MREHGVQDPDEVNTPETEVCKHDVLLWEPKAKCLAAKCVDYGVPRPIFAACGVLDFSTLAYSSLYFVVCKLFCVVRGCVIG